MSSGEWPLVGRREELELIEQAMARPGLAGVALAGAAGVGKTPPSFERPRVRSLMTRGLRPRLCLICVVALQLASCMGGGDSAPGAPATTPRGTGPGAYQEGSVSGIISTDGRFTTLIRILEAAEVRAGPPPGTVDGTAAEVMSRPGWDHTLFAPTDEAFEALDDATRETLLEPGAAVLLVRNHIVDEVIRFEDLPTGELATVGGPVQVTVGASEVRFGNAVIVEPDVEASNGIIHVIDAVVISTLEGA